MLFIFESLSLSFIPKQLFEVMEIICSKNITAVMHLFFV